MRGVAIKDNITGIKNIFFYTFILVYAAAITFLSARLNISNDEIFSLDTTSNNLSGVIRQSYNFEGQPPVYFILLSIWRNIDSSVFFGRLFSVLFVGLSAFVFYKFVRLITNEYCSRWIIILFLLNPYTVWTALEIRLYSFLLFISLTSIYFLLSYYIKGKSKYLYLFIFSCLVGLFTQYLYVYLIVAFSFAVLVFRGWKAFFKFFLYMLPLGLLFLYSLLHTTDPMALAYINSITNSFTERILMVLHSPQNLILGMHLLLVERIIRWAYLLLFILLISYTYIRWYKNNKLENTIYFKSFNAILLTAFILLSMVSAFFAITKLDFHDRYLTIAFPLFISVFLLFQTYPLLKRSLIFGTLAVLYIVMLIPQYRYQVKEYDTRSLTKYIAKIEKKDEPICFYHKVLSLQFKFNYNGKNTLVPLPDALKFDSSYLSKIKDTLDLRQSIERANPNSKSYLLITDRTQPNFENDADVKMLNSYLPDHYHITLDTLFYGHTKDFPLRIRRLEKK